MAGMNKESKTNSSEERSLRDILSDEIDRRLTENPPAKPTLEEFKAMAYKRLEEDKAAACNGIDVDNDEKRETVWTKLKANRKLRIACYACCCVLALIIGGAIWSGLTIDADADKNPKEEIVTEDGVIIEDGGWGSSVGEENVWTVDRWEDVEAIRTVEAKLMVPNYLPKNYSFERLTLEVLDTQVKLYEFTYTDGTDLLEIELYYNENFVNRLEVEDIDEVFETNKGKVYIQKGDSKIATMQTHDGIIINLWCNLSNEEIIKIIERIN